MVRSVQQGLLNTGQSSPICLGMYQNFRGILGSSLSFVLDEAEADFGAASAASSVSSAADGPRDNALPDDAHSDNALLDAYSKAVTKVVERVRPSVVRLGTTKLVILDIDAGPLHPGVLKALTDFKQFEIRCRNGTLAVVPEGFSHNGQLNGCRAIEIVDGRLPELQLLAANGG